MVAVSVSSVFPEYELRMTSVSGPTQPGIRDGHAQPLPVGADDQLAGDRRPAHAADQDVPDDVVRERELDRVGRRAGGVEGLHGPRGAEHQAQRVAGEQVRAVEKSH
jgi:hypothetical protein